MKVDLQTELRDLGRLFIRLCTMVGISIVSGCQLFLQALLLFFSFWAVIFTTGYKIGKRWQRRCIANRRLPELLTPTRTTEGGNRAE